MKNEIIVRLYNRCVTIPAHWYWKNYIYIGHKRYNFEYDRPRILKEGCIYRNFMYHTLEDRLRSANINTYEFLRLCSEAGYYELNVSEDCEKSISYLDANRLEKCLNNSKSLNDSSFRYRMKAGKFFQKIGLPDHERKALCFYGDNLQFKIVKGMEIMKYYKEGNSLPDSGSLSNSCMRYHNRNNCMRIYADNTEVCSMLIYIDKEEDKIAGRALLWQTSEGKILDRIYGNDSTVEKFILYAEKQGYIYKYNQSYSDKLRFIKDGEVVELEIDIDLKYDISNYDEFPYMDTFTYLSEDSISNYTGPYTADNTDGTLTGYNDEDNTIEDGHGNIINEEDARWCQDEEQYYHYDEVFYYRGRYYHKNNGVDVNGTTYPKDSEDIVFSDYMDEYILTGNSCWSDHENSYLHVDDCTHVDSEDDYFLNDDVVEIDGEYYLADSEEITTDEDGNFILLTL